MFDFIMDNCKNCTHYEVCSQERKDEYEQMSRQISNMSYDSSKVYDISVNVSCNHYRPYRYMPYYTSYNSGRDYRR